jgi:hypothetical protein
VGGAKQRLARLRRHAVLTDIAARPVELLAFVVHPARELRGQLRQRRLGARHRVVAVDRAADRALELVRRRDHLVIREALDRWEIRLD